MLIYSSNRRENHFTGIGWSHAEIRSCKVWPNLILKPVTRSTKGYSKFQENLVYRSLFFSVYCSISYFVTPSSPVFIAYKIFIPGRQWCILQTKKRIFQIINETNQLFYSVRINQVLCFILPFLHRMLMNLIWLAINNTCYS